MAHPAPLTAQNLFFTPLPPSHKPAAGKENHGRYMLTVPYNRTSGWGQAVISPRQELSFDPLAGVLQYAVTCFEGMKCYKSPKDTIHLFRPNKNFDRLKRSAGRLGLPCEWDNEQLLELLSKLLALEAPNVPSKPGESLYIRPTILETSESFGIKEDAYAAEALLYIVTSANLGYGLYGSADETSGEGKGLKLDACKEFIRAWPGGTGSYKLGANYGTVSVAKKPGYNMSLWLHGEEDFISEAGAMNVWIIKEAADGYTEFITMSLENGIVLPGITRESLIHLLKLHSSIVEKSNGHTEGEDLLKDLPEKVRVVERDISMGEIISGLEDGSLKGMFGCGTGVVVVQIGTIQYESKNYLIPANPVIKTLRDVMSNIQRGAIPHEWNYTVPEWEGVGLEKGTEGGEVTVA